jgi:hypothetical protein
VFDATTAGQAQRTKQIIAHTADVRHAQQAPQAAVSGVAAPPLAGSVTLPAPHCTRFDRFHLVNGLAIWKEGAVDPFELESYMASQRIMGSPQQVQSALMRLSGGPSSCFRAFSQIEAVRSLGDAEQTTFFKATMPPPVRPLLATG